MIIVCQNCSSRFQVDDDKISPRAIAKCPKCGQDINLGPASPASEKGAFAVGGSPATEIKRFEQPNPAPLFELGGETRNKPPSSSEAEKLVQMLAALLGQNPEIAASPAGERLPGKQRKALVCAPEEHREKVARPLAQEGYQVFVALDTKQAVERMRENQLDVVLLDPQFDAPDQGAAFVVREVNVLRPAQRRRLFFVLLSPSLRTMDAHGAFLNNVNAIINLKDLDDLVRILDHSLREYNELYKDFNAALRLAAV
jgi:predicted Zn finger-like uncharacterized protein